VLSLRHFGLARWCSLSLGGWWPRNPARRILASAGLRRAFSPAFRAGAMAFFIPWRVVAEESGAAHFGFGGAMRCSTCWPHDGEVAGGAVEISVLVNLVGGDDGAQAVGANDDRPMLMSASPGRGGGGRAQRPTGSSTTDRKICSTDSGGKRSAPADNERGPAVWTGPPLFWPPGFAQSFSGRLISAGELCGLFCDAFEFARCPGTYCRSCFKPRLDVRFIVIEGDDCRPALTTLISSVWHTRAKRSFGARRGRGYDRPSGAIRKT
jgi:hypothetical protein